MVSVMEKQLIPAGYKQTEVGVIPADWELSTIGENTHWMSGGTPSKQNDAYWAGKIPWISGSTLKSCEISTSDQFLTEEAVDAGSKMAPLNSTLLLVRGSALHNEIRAGLVVAPLAFNQDVKALVPNNSIAPKYLTWYLLGMNANLLKLVSSAGNSAGVLDTALVKNFNFFKPPKSEQTAIANVLSDVDALIAALEKLINKKSAIKTAAMQQLLTGKKRLPPFGQLNTGYKQSELGKIPGDWEVLDIQAMAKIGSGTTPARIQGDRYFKNGVSCWVKSLDLNYSEIRSTEELVTDLALKETCLQVYPKGTVLVAMYGGFNQIGRTGILNVPAAVNQAIVAIQVSGNYDSRYLLDTLNYRVEYWKSVASSSRKDPNITSLDIKQFKLILPATKQEQTAIANVLSDMDKDLAALQQRLHKTQQIKQGMMQELLTGKTRLVEPKGGQNA